jgi:hypothetical protein
MKAKSGYASALEWGSRLGLVLAISAFMIYLLGILPSHVGMAEIEHYWGLPLDEFVAATGIPTGPGSWITMMGTGYGLATSWAVLFSLVALFAYAAIAIPTILDRDYIYALFIVLELALMCAAMAGWIGG